MQDGMANVVKTSIAILLWMVWLLPAGAALGIMPPTDPDPRQVENLRRTMTLLNTSTPEHRNTVRILFYGQSITLQDWWLQVAQSIRDNYPSANLIIVNRAINGHTVDLLLRDALSDVYPFQPDLIIFQAYGPEEAHEQFMQNLLLRTCADVMWQNDHYASWDGEPGEPQPASTLTPTNVNWHSFVFMPNAAARYGDCLVDVRTPWEAYLRTNNLSRNDLLQDQIHPNADGRQLMANIIRPYLAPREGFVSPDPYNSQGVHTYRVGDQINWLNGALAVPFIGSRVDVILGPGQSIPLTAEIDGQQPSALTNNWVFTRTTTFGGYGFPSLLRVDSAAKLQAEHWELTVTASLGSDGFAFALHGSLTGDDGVGTNTMIFRSNSGRVVLHPEDWSLQLPAPGFKVSWDVVSLGTDTVYATPPADGQVESVITVAQNLSDDFHLLLLKATGPGTPAIRAVRVYSPAERYAATYRGPVVEFTFGRGAVPQLQWPAWLPGWQPEQRSSMDPAVEWTPLLGDPTLVQQKMALEVFGEAPISLYRLRFVGGVEGL